MTNSIEKIFIESRIKTLKLALLHLSPQKKIFNEPVLFIHGASFPVELAFAFKMNDYSWMDDIVNAGFDVYGLDFLGYGSSDRYPEMTQSTLQNKPLGKAKDVYLDINEAINYIIKRTGNPQVSIIAHSWGGSVAALYAQRFPEKVKKLVLFAPITVSNTTQKKSESIILLMKDLHQLKELNY